MYELYDISYSSLIGTSYAYVIPCINIIQYYLYAGVKK
ncbi:hypothetical protein J2746_000895 [Methanolobus bombayensis]|nr:hypothetical protein [Methanolobus bombayensis]